ncbi:MAG: arginine deiminase-related protein [Verrucomicrobiota bacterium]
MIRPCTFYPNPETAADNAFQREARGEDPAAISTRAQKEFDGAVERLREAGVTVHVFEDTATPEKPDAVFPNNWFSTHDDGRIVLYPMYSRSRRAERRHDVVEELGNFYRVREVIDYSPCEEGGLYLEGTGSLVLDHVERVAYASLSQRTSRELLEKFCAAFAYEPVAFTSAGADGRAIYHTNVLLCIGSAFALAGLELIRDEAQRSKVRARLRASGRAVIELSREQIENFAGNALELHNRKENLLVLSEHAAAHLTGDQRAIIERHARIISLTLPTIELAGGSARCLMATIHLPERN